MPGLVVTHKKTSLRKKLLFKTVCLFLPGQCKAGQHVDAAHPPSNQPDAGCAWEWLPERGVKTITVACLDASGFFDACQDSLLVEGYGCSYPSAMAKFQAAMQSCPNQGWHEQSFQVLT